MASWIARVADELPAQLLRGVEIDELVFKQIVFVQSDQSCVESVEVILEYVFEDFTVLRFFVRPQRRSVDGLEDQPTEAVKDGVIELNAVENELLRICCG